MTRFRSRWTSTLGMSACLFCFGSADTGAQAAPGGVSQISRPISSRIRIPAYVTDRNGNPVTGLQAADFRLTEDGKQQTIVNVANADALPLSILLLLDRSGSVNLSSEQLMKSMNALLRVFETLVTTGRPQLATVAFDTTVSVKQDFTADISQLPSVITAALNRPFGPGAFYDALSASSSMLGARPGKRIVLYVGDGDDTASRNSFNAAIEQLRRDSVEVTTIYTASNTPGLPRAGQSSRDLLERLSEDTGGLHFDSKDLKQLERIPQELASGYSIEYETTNSKANGKLRKVRIETVDRRNKVRHIPGYYVDE